MAAKLCGSVSSWPQSFVDFLVKNQGLGEGELRRKYVPIIHRTMVAPLVFAICQQIGVVFELLNREQFPVVEIVNSLAYALYFIIALTCVDMYGFCQSKTAQCMQNTTPRLHCYSGRGLPIFKYLILVFSLGLYITTFGSTIVFPVIRFNLTKKKPSFLVIPSWYPVDMLSTRPRMWVALFHESIVIWYAAYMTSTAVSMYYYAMMTTQIRLNALGRYFEDISSRIDRAASAEVGCSTKEISSSNNRAVSAERGKLKGICLLQRVNQSRNGIGENVATCILAAR